MSDPAIFDAHCLALGRLCVAWATIDRQLNDLLAALTGCSPAAAAAIATQADTVGARCSIMRNLVHEDPISEEWASAMVKMLTTLSDDLCKRRNRFAHDFWSLSEGTLVRMDRRASAKRQQSRKAIELVFDTKHVTPPDAVDDLTEEIGKMAFLIHTATIDASDWKKHRLHAAPPVLLRAYALDELPDVLRNIREEAQDTDGA